MLKTIKQCTYSILPKQPEETSGRRYVDYFAIWPMDT